MVFEYSQEILVEAMAKTKLVMVNEENKDSLPLGVTLMFANPMFIGAFNLDTQSVYIRDQPKGWFRKFLWGVFAGKTEHTIAHELLHAVQFEQYTPTIETFDTWSYAAEIDAYALTTLLQRENPSERHIRNIAKTIYLMYPNLRQFGDVDQMVKDLKTRIPYIRETVLPTLKQFVGM